jgi:hypothetical protein
MYARWRTSAHRLCAGICSQVRLLDISDAFELKTLDM